MPTPEPLSLSPEEVEETLCLSSPAQIKKTIATLSNSAIESAFALLSGREEKHWREKGWAALEGLIDTRQLEAAGKGCSSLFLLRLLADRTKKKKEILVERLTPLFVGLPQVTFCDLLHFADTSQIEPLKAVAGSEPLQHHILLFGHEIGKTNHQITQRFFELHKEIEDLDLAEMTAEDLQQMQSQIHHLAEYYQSTIIDLDKALSLAWNSNRTDLIEQLTTLKEDAMRQNALGIGENTDATFAPFSLHAILKAHLDSIFGDPENPDDIEALLDDDPAIEGLVKFNLWYLSDYVDLGLLPPLRTAEHKLTNDEREHLFQTVQTALEEAGLSTVGDLKSQGIFSLKMLEDYLAAKATH